MNPQPGGFVIDGTLGGGGHAREIIARLAPGGTFLGVDWNRTSVRRTGEALATEFGSRGVRMLFAHGSYANLPMMLRERRLPPADGLFLDLGLSSDELTGYGLSFAHDEPLDMRYGDHAARPSATDLVDRASREELARIIRTYGEDRNAERIATAIVRARTARRIRTTAELASLIERVVPRRGRLHPATRTFQALRIEVNHELEELERALSELTNIVHGGGRIAIITFHSLEDRLVKHRFAELARAHAAQLVFKKPTIPGPDEIRRNPRSRSAKLRALELSDDHTA